MLGYECNHCGDLIAISKVGETRDCPTCGCPADYTKPYAATPSNPPERGEGEKS